jgi:hypothetical protein
MIAYAEGFFTDIQDAISQPRNATCAGWRLLSVIEKDETADFVWRLFAPQSGIDEDR